MRSQFLLDQEVVFLNHGSFGATPLPVFESYQKWQLELERQPVEFLGRCASGLLTKSREILAEYLGTQPGNLVYVTNATTGLNIVARSLLLKAGDQVLASNHEYGALDRTWRFLSRKSGFEYINQNIILPLCNPEQLIDQLWHGVTERTRVIFISHITSPTALIFPIRDICRKARAAGILTVIDGAHAPGQIPLSLDDLGADFYCGNLHKWLCAPKGSAFLFARPEVQPLLEPLVISWGYESETPGPSPFIDLFEWTGTRDIAAFLAVPDAIRFQLENHWDRTREVCHRLAARALTAICERVKLEPLAVNPDPWFAQMVSAPLPDQIDIKSVKSRLYDQFRIEVPLFNWNGRSLIRVSCQAYNSDDDLERLMCALDHVLP